MTAILNRKNLQATVLTSILNVYWIWSKNFFFLNLTFIIVDIARVVETSYFGTGEDKIMVTKYDMTIGGMSAHVSMSDDCFPIMETVHGINKGSKC